MNPIKQSVSWWCFNQMEPQTLLRAAADIGYQAVELAEPEHWPLIRDHGLTIAAVGGHSSLADGLNRRENRDRITQEIEANLELAVKWGIPNLICFSGNRGGLSDEAGAEITAENLRAVAGMAEDAGVTLVLELLNSKVDHPDYQCDRAAWGVRVCEMVASPRVKLLYDIYHMQIMEGDIIRTIQDHHSHSAIITPPGCRAGTRSMRRRNCTTRPSSAPFRPPATTAGWGRSLSRPGTRSRRSGGRMICVT
jgi:hydroxypyruvate isomerase